IPTRRRVSLVGGPMSPATIEKAKPEKVIPPRRIRTRRIDFTYPQGELPHYFVGGGDPVMSHVMALLSALFPEGEDFFVRSVRNYRDRITDPELKKQVA